MRILSLLILWVLLAASSAYAITPNNPATPTAASISVAAPINTVATVTDLVGLAAAIAAANCGDLIPVTVATYSLALNTTLTLGTPGTGNGVPCEGSAAGVSAISGSSGVHAVSGSSGRSATSATGGGNYVTLQSASIGSLPASGTRVARTDVSNMPHIISNNATGAAFTVADGAKYWRFVGIEVKPNAATQGGTAFLFQAPTLASGLTTAPHHMIIERSAIHGDPTAGMLTAVQMCGPDMAVIDSRIWDVFTVAGTNEVQAVNSYCGGPYKIHNNELVAQSENVNMGDSNVHGADLSFFVPHDITLTSNYIHKETKWNQWDSQYSTGTAAINGAGTCVTLTGATVNAAWANGTYYFSIPGDTSGGYLLYSRLITAVGSCNGADSLTLTSAYPLHQGVGSLTYKITLWNGVTGTAQGLKNLYESKFSDTVLISANEFELAPEAAQSICITLSHRGPSPLEDYWIKDNRFRNCGHGIGITPRGTDTLSSGGESQVDNITAAAGTGLVKITASTGCGGCVASDVGTATVQIVGATGTTEANGNWPVTFISTTQPITFTIPVTFVNAYTGGAYFYIYYGGSPTSRIKITNNLFENISGRNHVSATSQFISLLVGVNPYLSAADDALSTSGNWAMPDLWFEHNTVVSVATLLDNQAHALRAVLTSIGNTQAVMPSSYTVEKLTNFVARNNIWKASVTGGSGLAAIAWNNVGSYSGGGTTTTNAWSDSASRETSYNIFTNPYSLASETASWTRTVDGPLSIVPTYTNVGFTAPADDAITGYALTSLYTASCTTSNASPNVTLTSGTLPASVVVGTPFKIDSDGTLVQIKTITDSTHIVLGDPISGASINYASTNTGQPCTFGYQGWSSDAADPGVDTSALSTALSGVKP